MPATLDRDESSASGESIITSAKDVRGTRPASAEVTARGISLAAVAAEALRRRAGSRGSIAAAALRRLGA